MQMLTASCKLVGQHAFPFHVVQFAYQICQFTQYQLKLNKECVAQHVKMVCFFFDLVRRFRFSPAGSNFLLFPPFHLHPSRLPLTFPMLPGFPSIPCPLIAVDFLRIRETQVILGCTSLNSKTCTRFPVNSKPVRFKFSLLSSERSLIYFSFIRSSLDSETFKRGIA